VFGNFHFCGLFQFPEALRPAFPRLKEKLEDSEPGKNLLHIYLFNESEKEMEHMKS